MSKIKSILIISLVVVMTLMTSSPVGAAIDLANYTGAKFEPAYGAYLGAYIDQDKIINADIGVFNEITGKQHATFFRYVGYGRPFPTAWVEELKAEGAVPQIAWEPNSGLDKVQDDEYLRNFARDAAASGVPVFLRYASEMNGPWCAYHGDPELYIEKWRLVHQVMAEEAPNVAMVWTVFTFPQGTIMEYYPGDDYVDWVGINVYNVVYHNNDINHHAAHQDPLELLDFFYQEFNGRKPIHISEWGVSHYNITDGKYYVKWAQSKLSRMYQGIITEKPGIKAIYYFNVNNLATAPAGRQINNYSLTSNEDVLKTYAQVVRPDFYLSSVLDNQTGVVVAGKQVELDTKLIMSQESTYVPLRPVLNALGVSPAFKQGVLELTSETGTIGLSIGSKGATVRGQMVTLGQVPLLYQGRTYLELADFELLFPQKVTLGKALEIELNEYDEVEDEN